MKFTSAVMEEKPAVDSDLLLTGSSADKDTSVPIVVTIPIMVDTNASAVKVVAKGWGRCMENHLKLFNFLTVVSSLAHLLVGIFAIDACSTAAYNYLFNVTQPYGGTWFALNIVMLAIYACFAGVSGLIGVCSAAPRHLFWSLFSLLFSGFSLGIRVVGRWFCSQSPDRYRWNPVGEIWQLVTTTPLPSAITPAVTTTTATPADAEDLIFLSERVRMVLDDVFYLNVAGIVVVLITLALLSKKQRIMGRA